MRRRCILLVSALALASAWPTGTSSENAAKDLKHWPSVEAKARAAVDKAALQQHFVEDTALCSVGMYYHRGVDGVPTCTKCPAGKFSDTVDASECSACEEGRFQLREGQINCDLNQCAAGTHKSLEEGFVPGAGCAFCPAGKFSGAAQMDCDACPSGQYTDTPGGKLADCKVSTCPAGKFQNLKFSGRSACSPCGRNQYQPEAGQTKCLYCKHGIVAQKSTVCKEHVAIGEYKECTHTTCGVEEMPDGHADNINVHVKGPQATQRFRVFHKGTHRSEDNWENGIHHRCHYSKELNKCMCVCWNPKHEEPVESEEPKNCVCGAVFQPVLCTSNNERYANECMATCAGATGCSDTNMFH